MSYPVAGMVRDYTHPGYEGGGHEIVPHGSMFAGCRRNLMLPTPTNELLR
jgi:hypothetical protein